MTACGDQQPTEPQHTAAVPVQASPGSAAFRPGLENQYIVVFRDDVAASRVSTLAAQISRAHGGTLRATWRHALRGFSLELPDRAALARLRQHPLVSFVEPNQIARLRNTQSNAPWGIDRVDQRDRPLNGTYQYRLTGAGVNVYVLDTGIRTTHNDFGGRASVGFALNFDFDESSLSGWNDAWCEAPNTSGHGTEVASIIGGSVHGVAKEVQLIGVRAFDCFNESPLDSMLLAVDWVTGNHQKPAVANFSAGCIGICASLDLAITNSVAAGVTWVVAAGNDGNDACLNSPGRSAEAISVAATRADDSRWSSSSWGSCVALFAPGASIPMASHLGNTATTVDSGTSFAAPHVAGVAALYLQQHPLATPAQVRTAILSWATPNRLTNIGAGSPNLLVFAPPPTTVSMSGPSALPSAGTYTWHAHPGGGNGTYTFQWDVRYWGTTAWEALGTASSQALSFTGGDADFELRVTATSVGHSVSSARTVQGPCHNHPWVACPFSVGAPIEVAGEPDRKTPMARRIP